jgi:hypothetical protein
LRKAPHHKEENSPPPSGGPLGINTAMLERAAMKSAASSEKKGKDSDDEGWSDDEKTSVSVTSAPKPQNNQILQPGARHPSGAIVKQAVSKPPEVSRKAPTKPPPLVSPSTVSSENSQEKSTPPPSNPAVQPPPAAPVAPAAPQPAAPPSNVGPPTSVAPPQNVAAESKPPAAENNHNHSEKNHEENNKPSTVVEEKKQETKEAKLAAFAKREADKIIELEEEVLDLKRKLERAEARLSQKEGSAGVMAREVALERELDEAHKKLAHLRAEKQGLELSVKELQIKLMEIEAPADLKPSTNYYSPGFNNNNNHSPYRDKVESSLKRGEREKQLETLLQKTKKDKDKAIKLIVQIIGKDRISSFLARNAGAPDILDRLLDHFGPDGGQVNAASSTLGMGSTFGNSPPNRSKSSGRSNYSSRSTSSGFEKTGGGGGGAAKGKSPAQYRSRIDEYYRSTISGRDI